MVLRCTRHHPAVDAHVAVDVMPYRTTSGSGGYGTVPIPSGELLFTDTTRTVAAVDPDYVTLVDIPSPIALYGTVIIYRAPTANSGQQASFRLFLNDILVDERTHTFTSDGVNGRSICLGLRGPGQPPSDGEWLGQDMADFAGASTWNAASTDDTVRFKSIPFTLAPNKFRVEMKMLAATVSSTFHVLLRYHPILKGNSKIWAGQIKTCYGSRPSVGTNDANYVTFLTVNGPCQVIGLVHCRAGVSVVGVANAQFKLIVDGVEWVSENRALNNVSAANSESCILGATPGMGQLIDLDSDSNSYVIADNYLCAPSFRFKNSLVVQSKRTGLSGSELEYTTAVVLVAPL